LESGSLIKGKVGFEINADAAKLAARQTGLTILSTLKANLGSLDKIKRVIKVFGMVNSTLDFEQHPFVINGCSELFAIIWGEENGIGVRSAVGMGSLPDNIPVEIEAIFELSNTESEIVITESVKEIKVEQ
jgi:enamine deaminase RidA (YjgF/YER057c/UK114 family)